MKKQLIWILTAIFAFGTMNAQSLREGDEAYDFKAKASLDGKPMDFSLSEALKKGPVVLYFFPSAYTQGCDIQAHTFSEFSEEFKKEGAQIVGMSADDIDRLNEFSADPDFCAGNFPVASDPHGEVAKRFGLEFIPAQEGMTDVRGDVIDHGFIPRVTFVIDTNRKILKVFSSKEHGLSPEQHVEASLKLIKSLK